MRLASARFLCGALVVASSVVAAANATAAPAPPDGRVFERVSPADTQGQQAIQGAGGVAIPLDDDTVIFGNGAVPSTADAQSGLNQTFVARRGPEGWATTSLLPATYGGAEGYALLDSTADLSASVWGTGSDLTTGGVPPTHEVYDQLRYREADGAYTTIYEEGAPLPTGSFAYGGMSQDGGSVVFASARPPAGASDPSGLRRVWRWHPGGSSEALGSDPGSPIADCNVEVAGSGGLVYNAGGDSTVNAVSADGRTVFLHSDPTPGVPACPQNAEPSESQVYVSSGGRTTFVAEPEGGPEPGQAPSFFKGATPDGRTAWIETEAPLTSEDNLVAHGISNIYRWEAASGTQGARLTCLTCAGPGVVSSAPSRASVLSPSGSYFYFVKQTGEEQGLFVENEGDVREVPLERGAQNIELLGAQVNRSGDVLLFTELGRIYRVAVGPQSIEVGPLALNEAGEAAAGNILPLFSRGELHGALQTAGLAGHGGIISEDGQTIAFESGEALAPGAEEAREFRPGEIPVANIYRWHDGKVAFLAKGSRTDGYTPGAAVSADGDDIFFLSAEKFVPNELQSAASIYDARIGGGFPPAPAPAAPCRSETACQGNPLSPPALPAPRSSASSGNPKAVARLKLLRPSAAELARFARSGSVSLRVRAGGGTLAVLARAKVGGHQATVARAKQKLEAKIGTVVVRLKLSAGARKALRDSGRLRLRVVAGLTGAGREAMTIVLKMGGGR